MRRNCRDLMVILAAAALAALFAVPGASAKRPTCKRAHTKTLERNHVARVYTRAGDGSTYDARLLGCLRSNGKAIRLADRLLDPELGSDFGHVRLTRRFVGFTFTISDNSCKAACPPGYDADDDQVAVRDLTHRWTRRVHIDSGASAVFVGTKGAVAWTEGSGSEVTLGLRNSNGTTTITGVARHSVRRHGNELVWSRFGHDERMGMGRY